MQVEQALGIPMSKKFVTARPDVQTEKRACHSEARRALIRYV